jgi:hypothetical protein
MLPSRAEVPECRSPSLSGEDEEAPTYQVGYRKPPPEHRFKKGRSGNPSGRPRKQRQQGEPPSSKLLGADEPVKGWILDEAYRMVTIREGDRVIQLPVIKAVLRSMGVSALKGNRFAQATLAELVTRVEDERRASQFEWFKTAVEYKDHWEAEIARCKRLGLPDPEPLPHPDDVIVDPRNGTAHFAGPITPAEKADFDRAIDYRDDLIEEAAWFRQKLARRSGGNWQKLLDQSLELIDRMNAALPKRYRRLFTDVYDLKGRRKAAGP